MNVFENDDGKYFESDDIRAGWMIAGLAGLVAALLFIGTGYLLKDEDPGKGPLAFFVGFGAYAMGGACYYFAQYDVLFEKQTDEDTLKTGQIFTALFFTIGWVTLAGSAFFFKQTSTAAMLFAAAWAASIFSIFVERWSDYDAKFEGPQEESGQKATLAFVAIGYCETPLANPGTYLFSSHLLSGVWYQSGTIWYLIGTIPTIASYR